MEGYRVRSLGLLIFSSSMYIPTIAAISESVVFHNLINAVE